MLKILSNARRNILKEKRKTEKNKRESHISRLALEWMTRFLEKILPDNGGWRFFAKPVGLDLDSRCAEGLREAAYLCLIFFCDDKLAEYRRYSMIPIVGGLFLAVAFNRPKKPPKKGALRYLPQARTPEAKPQELNMS